MKFKANEAAMTGEPIDIGKDTERDPFMLSGTSISEGSGRMIVTCVGGRSQWGVTVAYTHLTLPTNREV